MRVAVLGSWREEDKKEWGLRENIERFRAACQQVGSELVERGHSLIVGTDSKHTADGNAVLGAIEAVRMVKTTVESPRIMLIRSESPDESSDEAVPFDELRRSMPGVFIEHPDPPESEAAVKFVQTQLADLGRESRTEGSVSFPADCTFREGGLS